MAMSDVLSTAGSLDISRLYKSYGAVDVLKDINVSMQAGDFLVLVGPSGCGKSTLLNCIAGLEEVTSGTINIAGRDVTSTPPRDRDIAMVFQSYALYPTMSVAENISFGMRIRRMDKATIDKRIREVAELLQIDHLLDRKPSQLSGGQRQRVAMGRALVRDPALFLFDEPLSNLDAKLRVEMRAEIKSLHQRSGASIVYVTHDQIEAMTLATKIVVMKGGIVQQIGTPEDIYDRPANMFVADFMGSPPMNLVPAQIAGKALKFADGSLLDAPALVGSAGSTSNVIFGIRPENLSFTGPAGTGVTVTPRLVEHTGADTYVTADLAGHTITARIPGKFTGKPGEPVAIYADLSHACLFDPQTTDRMAG